MPLERVEAEVKNLPKHIHTVSFSGRVGDPFMHPEILECIRICTKYRKRVRVHSNLSYDISKERWKRIMEDYNVKVVASVDGLRETNHIYRRGASFDLIQRSLETISGIGCGKQLNWHYVVYKHNEDDLFPAINYAFQELGAYGFQVKVSDRNLENVLKYSTRFPCVLSRQTLCQYEANKSPLFTRFKSLVNSPILCCLGGKTLPGYEEHVVDYPYDMRNVCDRYAKCRKTKMKSTQEFYNDYTNKLVKCVHSRYEIISPEDCMQNITNFSVEV